MRILPAARFAIPFLFLGAVLRPGEAAAQTAARPDTVRVGEHMDESTGYDQSYVVVFARGQSREGAVMWSCGDDPGGFISAVRLGEDGVDGATRRMVWSVDGGAPDTTRVQGVPGSRVWFVRNEDATAFAARARTAARMAIHVSREGSPEQDVEYTYALAGMDSALTRLRCGRDAGLAGVPTGREALRHLSTEPFLGRDGRMVFEPRPAGWLPRLLNPEDLADFLRRRFPADPRQEGVSGQVLLRIHVLRNGRVEPGSVRVVRADDVRYVPVAAAAVETLRFRPARRNGRPADVWVTFPIHFATTR